MTEPLTREQLSALEADFQRQLGRTRLVPTEPSISVNADLLRALIAAAKERDELRARLVKAQKALEFVCDEWCFEPNIINEALDEIRRNTLDQAANNSR